MFQHLKQFVFVAGTTLAMVLMIGCAGTKPGKGYVSDIPSEIQKLIKDKYSEALYSVGTATGPNEGIAKRKATMQARAEIAREFKAQIDGLKKMYEEAVNNKSLEEYKQTIEIFASLEVSGSKIAKSMVRKEKTGYSAKVLVVVSAEQLKAIIDEKMQALTSFRASKAYKELEERVEKERERTGQ